tara:strand:- start:1077 stop:1643 length:567 start_codon:yes stop_codon:yes gene_type:complete
MIIAGLGNPGTQYANTKHNMGYWVLDKLADEFNLNFKLGKGEYMHTKNTQLSLVKPIGYMNNSGVAVKSYVNYFGLNINDLLVIYDDADLPLGEIRFKSNGSAGGQKGVESIIYQFNTEAFLRLKVGIATNEQMRPLEAYVLTPFKSEYNDLVDSTIIECVDAIKFLINHNINDTMNKYNKNNNKGNK